MPKSFAAFATAVLLSGSLCMQPSFCAAQGGDTAVKEGPDAEVQEFRLADLEVRLRTIKRGRKRLSLRSRFIGYPVFQALGTVSFLRDGECEAGDATRWSGAGARTYMKLLTPVIECTVEGKNLPFSFDTGASGTDLLVRCYHLFRTRSKSSKRDKSKSFGAGGLVKRKIYIQPQV